MIIDDLLSMDYGNKITEKYKYQLKIGNCGLKDFLPIFT
jgi:hypothetical protein